MELLLRDSVFCGSDPSYITRIIGQLGRELREPLEMAVNDDEKRKQRVIY
jgi:hypothetical protein